MDYRVREGLPFPMGAHWDGKGVNFALFSRNASKVELCLFADDGQRELARIALPEYSNEVWHGYIEGLAPGQLYGYRVHGEYAPEAGHRFNANKLLIDPYARQLWGELRWDPALFGYEIGHKDKDLSFDERDSAPFIPKCRVVDEGYDWGSDRHPQKAWNETSFYEMHVRGMTMRHPKVRDDLRGTFAGLATPDLLDYVRALGVSAIELMPIHAFVHDQYLLDKGLRNYWGYNSIAFFAPHPQYLSDGGIEEFKRFVAAAHERDLEVVLDVVYNHTAEGSELGPTLSFRGIDNAVYYKLLPDQGRYYINDTGTGNTLDTGHPRVVQMVTDSLRYWVEVMHVDGFRFDLATILGREPDGFSQRNGFFVAVAQDPTLARVKLVAEPWDSGPGGYQLGNFPPGWAEWNGRYRDTLRAFWRGDPGQLPDLARRLTASGDIYDHQGRSPFASVNFVAVHDGFSLYDLTAYNDKHNEANGDDNRDGSDDNRSWNCGVEGPTDQEDIVELRQRQMRNFLASLFFSQGVPLLCSGDEFGATRQGNNNVYCQDNDLGWLHWDHDAAAQAQIRFVQKVIQLRQRYPMLRHGRFLLGRYHETLKVKDVSWINANGEEMTEGEWQDENARCLGVLLDGRAQATGIVRCGEDDTLLLILNAAAQAVEFCLPKVSEGKSWERLVDTNIPDADAQSFALSAPYLVTARSLLLFVLRTQ